jgi:hypothetical protein
MMRKFRVLIVLAVLGLSIGGCDVVNTVKEGLAQSEAVAVAIERQAGVKPEVGFNYHNGAFTAATIQFPSVPAASLPEVEQIARRAVVASFKREPENLVVSFVFKKNGR